MTADDLCPNSKADIPAATFRRVYVIVQFSGEEHSPLGSLFPSNSVLAVHFECHLQLNFEWRIETTDSKLKRLLASWHVRKANKRGHSNTSQGRIA